MAVPAFPSTVDALVRRSAARVGDRVALHFGERSWTYAALDDATTRVAARLLGLGLAKGDRVAGLGRNSDAFLLLFLACARAGLVHVPVNFNVAGAELAYLVDQPGCAALFHDAAFAERVDAVPLGISHRHGFDELLGWATEGEVPELDVAVGDEDLVQLLFTSGTTSAPKGAMMTHRALVHHYLSCIVALGLDEHEVTAHALPLYHSAQLHVFLMPLLALGATGHIVEAPVPADLLERIERDRLTSLFAPPTVWIGLGEHPDFATRDLSSLRDAYYGASIMPTPVLQRLRAALPQVGFHNAFGQSEIGPLAAVLGPDEHDARPDSAGRPVLFVEVRVVDDEGRDVAAGELGEVLYRSPQLCSGYWDKPQETAEAFRDGWFHSGDLVRRDEEGYLFVVDRVKDVINTGGVLVASREVEEALYLHPAVAEVAVIGLPHPRWIEAVTAVVVLRAPATEDELVAHAREHLAPFKVPKAVHRVDELPKNPSGKLLKRELRDRFGAD